MSDISLHKRFNDIKDHLGTEGRTMMTVAEYLRSYVALRYKYPESLQIQTIVAMLNALVIQGLADRSCAQFHDQFWIDYPEIPSATEAGIEVAREVRG